MPDQLKLVRLTLWLEMSAPKNPVYYKAMVIALGLLIFCFGIYLASEQVPYAGFIDKNGKLQVKLAADAEAGEFHDGLAPVKVGSSWGYINRTGAWVIPPQFGKASNFSQGLAAVFIKDKKVYAFINRQAKGVLEVDATAVGDFHDGIAMVVKGDKCGYIDHTGKDVIPMVYRFVEARYSSQGVIPVALMFKDKSTAIKWTFVDHKNHPVVPEVFDGAKEVTDAMAPVMYKVAREDNSKEVVDVWGWLNASGKSFAVKPEYADIEPFSEGYAHVKLLVDPKSSGPQKQHTFIDNKGKQFTQRFDGAGSFSDGLAAVALLSAESKILWGFINSKGELAIAPRFDLASKFSEGLAFTARKGVRPFWEPY